MESVTKSGHEIAAEEKDKEKFINLLAKEMKLRQWCVDKAIESGISPSKPAEQTKEIVQYFYDFITGKV